MGKKARLKGQRKQQREFVVLTEDDKKILRAYNDLINSTCLHPWEEDNRSDDYYDMAHGLTEMYLEHIRPNELIEGTPLEKWRIADATIEKMWSTVKSHALEMLRRPVHEGSYREQIGEGR